MGLFVWGAPRGQKIAFLGTQEFTTLGSGAIHVRILDERGPCTVRLDRGHVGLVPIVSEDG